MRLTKKQSTGRGGIILKSSREIELMRAAGKLVEQVLSEVASMVRPGMTTRQLNAHAERLIEGAGAVALFKGVENPEARFPFPAALCTSVNEEIVHGLPNDRPLALGDIVGIDCGVRLNGYCGDSAVTVPVGQVSPEVGRLLKVTRESLDFAIAEMHLGRAWSEVARVIQGHVESNGMSVIRDFVGHGIGRSMHEDPKVPNYWDRKSGPDFRLDRGMVLAVEPMVALGKPSVRYAGPERWIVRTQDGSFTAHFEHTVAMTESGPLVLTRTRS